MACAVAVLALLLLQTGQPNAAANGLKALEEQRWDAAIASFSQAVSEDPKNFVLRFNLAFGYSMAGQTDSAVREYRTVLDLKPGLYEAQLNLGMLLFQLKQPQEAATLLEQAALQKPQEFRPVQYAGEAHLLAGNYPQAIVSFRKSLDLQPQAVDATLGLARALAKDGKLTEAEPLFRKASVASPEVRLELATLLEAAGKNAEAAEIYLSVPDNIAAQERAGELLLESGKAEAAIPGLETAVQKSPTAANRFALGMAYNVTKKYEKAEPLFAAALQAEPANAALRMAYARVLRQQRKYAPAAQEFARVTQANPKSSEAWSDLAGVLVLLDNYPQALHALDRVRGLGTENPGHFYLRAIILDRGKVMDGALESYEKFLSLSQGKYPDEEFKARQRIRIIKRESDKR
ncbi:MAG: tetratricopeptide repeat protein [Bryobacteraceae bacterium]|nr:tetratricopeptide repeat protein [Bryobacteraceae bacterium]